jgi:hypothetical protein
MVAQPDADCYDPGMLLNKLNLLLELPWLQGAQLVWL